MSDDHDHHYSASPQKFSIKPLIGRLFKKNNNAKIISMSALKVNDIPISHLPIPLNGTAVNWLLLSSATDAPELFADSLHTGLTQFLGIVFSNSKLELNDDKTLALNQVVAFMLKIKTQAFYAQGTPEVAPFLCLSIGEIAPQKYATALHRALSLFLAQVLNSAQTIFDQEEAKIMGKVANLIVLLQNIGPQSND